MQMIDSNSSNNNDNNSNKRVKLDHHDDSNSNSNDNSLFIDKPLIAPSIATTATETKVIEYCHANDIISLVYLNANTTNTNNDFILHEPTYTHQLFEVMLPTQLSRLILLLTRTLTLPLPPPLLSLLLLLLIQLLE